MAVYRIFVSSPGDVAPERQEAARVIERLRVDWSKRLEIEPVFWEHEPLAADATYQAQITPPDECDAVVVILWSRFGSRLPADITRPDGTRYDSGTEYEIERSLEAHAAHGRPELLVYHKSKKELGSESREEAEARWRQKEKLDEMIERLFRHRDGTAARAKTSFEETEEFGHLLHLHLDELISRRVEELDGVARPKGPLWQGSPFRGLEVFEAEHERIFCGRDRRVREVIDALTEQERRGAPFVLVTGPSGSGKSSLMRAGVIPRLTVPDGIPGIGMWRRAIWLPGSTDDPFAGLAEALVEALPQLGSDAASLAVVLRERPGEAVAQVRLGIELAAAAEKRRLRLDRQPDARLFLLVDQADELFTSERVDDDARTRLDRTLSALATSGLVWVVATVRDDFRGQLATLPALMRLEGQSGRVHVPPPEPEEIGSMIREPAAIAGLRYEVDERTGQRLDDVLRDDAVARGTLPLLSFALQELYRRRSEDGVLTYGAYRALGRLEGALSRRAEEVFSGLSPAAQAALGPVLFSLVRVGPEDDAVPTRRRAPRAALEQIPGGRELVDVFVREHLFTAARGPTGESVVSVAHEALLRAWPEVSTWRETHRDLLATRSRLELEGEAWAAGGESPDHLIRDPDLLDRASALVEQKGLPLGEREVRLVRASLAARDETESRRVRRLRWAAVAAVLVLGAGLLVWYGWFRPHTAYYERYVFRDAVPVGIGRIDEATLARRWSSYEVRRRGRFGRIEQMAAVDGQKRPTYLHDYNGFLVDPVPSQDMNIWDPQTFIGRDCIWRMDYEEDGEVGRLVALNRAGATVYELEYQNGLAREDGLLVAQYVRDGVAASQADSGAASVWTWWSDEGYLEAIAHAAPDGSPRPDRQLSWGTRVEQIDSNGLPLRMVSLGRVDTQDRTGERIRYVDPSLNRSGFAAAEFQYDERGRVTRADYYDASGSRPVLTRFGYSKAEFEYDEDGNRRSETHLNTQGDPMPGVHRVLYGRTGDGELEISFRDQEGEAKVGPGGYHGLRMRFYETGELESFFVLGPEGDRVDLPVLERSGMEFEWAELRASEPDSRGLSRITYLDRHGEPAPELTLEGERNGFVSQAYNYDQHNNLLEVRYLNSAGIDIENLGTIGYARVVKDYDDQGRMIHQRYLDSQGRPTRDLTHCYAWEVDYLKRDIVERRCLGRQGRLEDAGRLGAVWRTFYDTSGQPIEDQFFNAARRPVNARYGCWIARLRADLRGGDLDNLLLMVLSQLLEAQSRPQTDSHCSRLETRYGPQGDVSLAAYYQYDPRQSINKPHAYELGCARVGVLHDFRGRVIERRCLGANDRVIASSLGWERIEIDYDEEGQSIVRYVGANDTELTLSQQGSNQWLMQVLQDGSPPPPPVRVKAETNRTSSRSPPEPSTPDDDPEPIPGPDSEEPDEPEPPPVVTETVRDPMLDADRVADTIQRLADRLQDQYDDFLDDSNYDAVEDEDDELEDLFSELEDAGDDLRDAAEEWADGDLSRGKVMIEVSNVKSLARRIESLAGRYPIGGPAERTWVEVRSLLAQLPEG